jgi:hypothetical protein
MLFSIKNTRRASAEQLRSSTLLDAYFIIQSYSLLATDMPMNNFIQQQYGVSLKNMCINLLLNLTFHEDNAGNLILLFRDQKHDAIARLITYGNGAIPGCRILKVALSV